MSRAVLTLVLLSHGCFADEGGGDDDDAASGATETDGETSTSTGAEATSMSASTASSMSASGTSASGTTASSTDATSTTDDTDGMTTDDPGSSSSGAGVDEILIDLAASACDAAWTNDLDEVVECPKLPNDPTASAGSVFRAEDQSITVDTLGITVNADAIATHPRWVAGGQVLGRYPEMEFEPGDVVRAQIACVQAAGCDVEVVVAWATPKTKPQTIESIPLTFADTDGIDIDVEIPQNPGAVQIVLIVDSAAETASDGVVWIEPRVVRPGG